MNGSPLATGALDRVGRLEELKLLLAEREYTTAADLAADLGVSVRTLHRDLATLRDLGVPIAGLSGRGGGVHLERGWSLGRVHLNESEAMGLLLALAIAEQVGSPLLLGDLRSIERKVTQAFAPSQTSRIRGLRRRVITGGPASSAVRAGYVVPSPAVTRPLLEAFIARRPLDIGYRDRGGTPSARSIEVHHLYYSLPVWYALAWDRLRGDIRAFRIDRIATATVAAGSFTLRPPEQFVDEVAGAPRHL